MNNCNVIARDGIVTLRRTVINEFVVISSK
jgi:hypothetical protein